MMHKAEKEVNQYRIVRVIEKMRKYEVIDKDEEQAEDRKTYQMLRFEKKEQYLTFMKYYN